MPALLNLNEKILFNMRQAQRRTQQPEELLEVWAVGIRRLQHLPAHFPRHLEYPWVLNRLRALPGLSRAVDVGAGISPMPVCLAEGGIEVLTFDSSDMHRDWDNREGGWSAWGYIDYGARFSGITSYNEEFRAARIKDPVEAVYTVSVIEHMPHTERQSLWREAAATLGPGGYMVHTIDLQAGTDLLWNRAEGELVEAPTLHGTTNDIRDELSGAGFEIVQEDRFTELPRVSVDSWLLVCRKTG